VDYDLEDYLLRSLTHVEYPVGRLAVVHGGCEGRVLGQLARLEAEARAGQQPHLQRLEVFTRGTPLGEASALVL
jgi:hypothetical protein